VRGLDLPITNPPKQTVSNEPDVTQAALLGDDYVGMKPTMLVQVGDRVKRGQPVIEDKKNPGVIFTSPVSGTVNAIHRGEKRRFLSMVFDIDDDESVDFEAFGDDLHKLTPETVRRQLISSGLWTSLRTRPYSKTPTVDSTPDSIFVTAIDTNPLAANPEVVVAQNHEKFVLGLHALSTLTKNNVYLCLAPNGDIRGDQVPKVQTEVFDGPHPAGLVGTHINIVNPVGPTKTHWHINYQDVIAIGTLLFDGTLDASRIIALAGPGVEDPRLIKTVIGANLDQLTTGQLNEGENRIISGSILSGRQSQEPVSFLGRFHLQVSVIKEDHEREFLGWMAPGLKKFSVTRAFASAMNPAQRVSFTTATGGSRRSMVPIGSYERVMPLDILPTQLLRALIVGDTDTAQQLGALELDEEDLALCTFVCPGKYEYGSMLRQNLKQIEIEG
tara:strand:+ start:1592 stop:2920 length:1329 start_codon:yes stop_codon:yes gene_type:complete